MGEPAPSEQMWEGHGRVISWRRLAGWLRLWLVGALVWVAYAGVRVHDTWAPPAERVIDGRPIFGAEAARRALSAGAAEARPQCIDSSITAAVRPDALPPDAKHGEADPSLVRSVARRFQISAAQAREDLRIVQPPRTWLENAIQAEGEQERARRLAAHDYHTHVLSVSCITEATMRDWIAADAAFILVPPVAVVVVPFVLVLLLLFVGRWVVAGFRPAMAGAPVSDAASSSHAPRRPSVLRLPRWVQWALGLVILVGGLSVGHALSNATKAELADRHAAPARDRDAALEQQLRARLPIAPGDGVFGVDVAVEPRGLRWTYQRQAPARLSDPAYLDSVVARACAVPLVRAMTARGFWVEYDLIATDGRPLGARRVNHC